MMEPTVKKVTASDMAPAIDVVVSAFSADPSARWMYPDQRQYSENFPEFVRAFGGRAFEAGSAYCVDGYSGAALWLPPGVHSDEEALAKLIERTIPAEDREEMLALFEQMAGYHPEEPHWYLPLIGVDPARQGKGYGSALLKHTLAACDRDRKLAYLEASSPTSVPLYERHGFEVLGTVQVGSSPPTFPMLRRPQ
jgi:GNAT superfamily N-acetyltransferase